MRTELFLIIILNLLQKDESLKSSQQRNTKIQRVIELYQSGLSMKEVSLQIGVTPQRVEQILKKAGVQTRKYTTSKRLLEARKRKRRILPKELLLKFYNEECLPISEIIEKLDVSLPSFYKSLEYHKITKRKTEGIHYSSLTEELLRRLYLEEDLTAQEIAKKLGFAGITIKKRLSKFGIKKRGRQT